METNGENSKQSATEVRINSVDLLTPSPERRAERVFEVLRDKHGNEFDSWDLFCFSAHYLGNLLPVHPDLGKPLKAINKYLYNLHYFRGEEMGLYSIPEEIKNALKKE